MAKRILHKIRLDRIAAVDYPCQEGARAVLIKRADPDAIALNKEAEVADIAEITKRAEAAEAQVAELTKKLADAEALAKRADDEILKVGETEIRKSAVGAEMFAFAKAQNEALAKAREEAELTSLAKRASTEFGALPGTDIVKARILKAASAMPEEVAKALEAALSAGNAAMKLGFEKAGMVGGAPSGSAQDEINTLAKARAAKDGISFAKASVLIMDENPELYKRADAEHAARVKGA